MALIGHGTTLTIIGPTGTTTVNETLACLSIDFGSNKVDTPETTDMLSTGTAKVFIPGLENSGDLSLKYNMKPGDAGQAALADAKGLLYDFKVTYPLNVGSRTFTGIVTGVDIGVPDDKLITRAAKIQISGPVVDADTPLSTVAVPDVVGLSQSAATTALTGVGLTVGSVSHVTGSGVTAGDVVSTSPVYGALAVVGSAVNLVLET